MEDSNSTQVPEGNGKATPPGQTIDINPQQMTFDYMADQHQIPQIDTDPINPLKSKNKAQPLVSEAGYYGNVDSASRTSVSSHHDRNQSLPNNSSQLFDQPPQVNLNRAATVAESGRPTKISNVPTIPSMTIPNSTSFQFPPPPSAANIQQQPLFEIASQNIYEENNSQTPFISIPTFGEEILPPEGPSIIIPDFLQLNNEPNQTGVPVQIEIPNQIEIPDTQNFQSQVPSTNQQQLQNITLNQPVSSEVEQPRPFYDGQPIQQSQDNTHTRNNSTRNYASSTSSSKSNDTKNPSEYALHILFTQVSINHFVKFATVFLTSVAY